MKRLAFLAAMVVTLLSTTAVTARSVHASTCTPNWHTVQGGPILAPGFVVEGSVSLSRDGCGDIQASIVSFTGLRSHIGLTITNVTTSTTVYASGVVFQRSLTSPIFSGYGGVGISVTGTLYDFTPPLSATTTPDYGT